MDTRKKIEMSGKIASLDPKEKNFAMFLEGSDVKYYVYGKIPDNIKVGDDISFNFIENKVGQFIYKNVQDIHPEGFVPDADADVETVKVGEKKVYFVDKYKDITIVRQNVLRTSVMALEVLNKINPEKANTLLGEEGGIANAVKNLARTLEDEVFRDNEDTKH